MQWKLRGDRRFIIDYVDFLKVITVLFLYLLATRNIIFFFQSLFHVLCTLRKGAGGGR